MTTSGCRLLKWTTEGTVLVPRQVTTSVLIMPGSFRNLIERVIFPIEIRHLVNYATTVYLEVNCCYFSSYVSSQQ